MAFNLSLPTANLATTSAGSSYSLVAFTPTANAFLVVFVYAAGTVAAGTMSGGGLTWTRRISNLFNGAGNTAYIFTAQVGASPVSTTIAFSCAGDNASGCLMTCVQITGHYIELPIKQVASKTGSSTTPNIDVVTTQYNALYLASFGCGTNPANPSSYPSGYGVLANIGHAGPLTGMALGYKIQTDIVTNVQFTKGSSVAWGANFIEINEDLPKNQLMLKGHGI